MRGMRTKHKQRPSRSLCFTRVAMIIRIIAGWDGTCQSIRPDHDGSVRQIGAAITITAFQ
jgi:hypothetical protein